MSATPDTTHGASVATLRARLRALVEARARGELDEPGYEAARRDAERQLGEAVLAEPADEVPPRAAPAPRARPSMRLVLALLALVLVVAIGGYAATGSPGLATRDAPVAARPSDAENDAGREAGLQQIATMVDKLADRLKERPDDAEGWTMLARSYTVLKRYADAVPAYRHAVTLKPQDAGLLADYSDALAASEGGRPTKESLALIDRALAIDPAQPKALALAGTVAFDQGDFAGAVARWQKIADALPPDSEFHRQVMDNIDEARRRGGLPPSAPAPAAAPAAATAGPPAASSDGREALTGTVTLAPALAGKVAPTDTVFVLARAEGARMPLAVRRATVADLPLRFTLDDSMAMTPTMKISSVPRVLVVARISKSGNAMTQPGDLSAEIGPVAPGTRDLAITIATEVPAK